MFKIMIASLLLVSPLNAELYSTLLRHEGYETEVYECTMGHRTIGIGFNIDANLKSFKAMIPNWKDVLNGQPLSKEQIQLLFDFSISISKERAFNFIPNLDEYPENVQNTIIMMAFNLGDGLYKFKKFRDYIVSGDLQNARGELRDSKWYGQLPSRIDEIIAILSKK